MIYKKALPQECQIPQGISLQIFLGHNYRDSKPWPREVWPPEYSAASGPLQPVAARVRSRENGVFINNMTYIYNLYF